MRCPPQSLSLDSLGGTIVFIQPRTKAMKQISTATTLVAGIALLVSACENAPTASQPDARAKSLALNRFTNK